MKGELQMERLGLPVNWYTIKVGWEGLGSRTRLVSSEEVISRATDQLAAGDVGATPRCLVALAAADPASTEEISRQLTCLAGDSGADGETEARKWRLGMLLDVLDGLPEDHVDGLLALTEFWADLGFPSDSPHDVQGLDDALSPQEYYTPEHYEEVLGDHRQWAHREHAILRSH